jgi:hypothetical protein
MTPKAITLLFWEAHKAFPPLKGKPLDNNLTTIRETLLPILMEIPYDQLGGVHSLTAILTDPGRYAADHGGSTFVRPSRLRLYDKNIANDALTVVRVCGEAAHKARLDNYASYKAAKRSAAKLLLATVDETWYANLKGANTFYMKVLAVDVMAFLDANSRGLHAIDMLTLRTNMHGYYTQADGVPQYIIMLEEAQKKAKQAGMPIADIELVMVALAVVLAAMHFPRKVDDWEGLPMLGRTWAAWKTSFCSAHLKRQHQILALGGGEPLGGAHGVLPTDPMATFNRLEIALDNLALAVTNNTAVLQQLTAANLALTKSVAALTATNKKLVDAAATQVPATPPGTGRLPGSGAPNRAFKGNYCWAHGHKCSKLHTSATCLYPAAGHHKDATLANTFGGSKKDKGWDT